MWQQDDRQYTSRGLDRSQLQDDPIIQLQNWMEEAQLYEPEAHAMALSTSTLTHQPSLRMVLIKKIGTEGLFFFSHYESRKGKEISKNPQVSGLFYWPHLERQIIVEGVCEIISEQLSDSYFASRPIQSQIATCISRQGEVIESRQDLLYRYNKAIDQASSHGLKRPAWWGGYCLKPTRFEFWQGREYRLHDRFQYVQKSEKWLIQRLSP